MMLFGLLALVLAAFGFRGYLLARKLTDKFAQREASDGMIEALARRLGEASLQIEQISRRVDAFEGKTASADAGLAKPDATPLDAKNMSFAAEPMPKAPPETLQPASRLPGAPSPPAVPAISTGEAVSGMTRESAAGADEKLASSADATRPERVATTRSLEERIGARWSVWAGALALGLGGILLVRYSIQAGFFGPAFRVIAGLLLAAALAACGEWLRRSEAAQLHGATAGRFQGAYIPGALTAAGSVTAFASLYAAHALYGFIGPGVALAALGAVGIATMLAAQTHGPTLGALGLLGAFGAPLLVSSSRPNAWAAVLYLAVIGGVSQYLAWRRNWRWLSFSAAGAAALWTLILLPTFAAATTHLVLATAMLVASLLARESAERDRQSSTGGSSAPVAMDACLALSVGVVIAALLLLGGASSRDFGAVWITGAALLTLLPLIAALRSPRLAPVALAAAVLAKWTLFIWPPQGVLRLDRLHSSFGELFVTPDSRLAFCIYASFAALVIGGGCAAVVLRRAMAVGWPALSYWLAMSAAPLAALTLAYLRFDYPQASMRFAIVALLVMAAFAQGARIARRQGEGFDVTQGVFACAAIAALALALAFGLDGALLPAGFALAALASSFVATRMNITLLRWSLVGLGLLVCARLAYDPQLVAGALSSRPVFNWLLVAYGLPALCFALAARTLRGARDDTPADVADALAVLFAALLAFFEIRHFMNGGDALARQSGLVEQGLLTLMSFGFSLVLTRLDAGRANIVFRYASLAAAPIGFMQALGWLLLRHNPLLSAEPVAGGLAINALLPGYLVPAAMAGVLTWYARRTRPDWYIYGAAISTIALTLAYLLLETRLLFHGARIGLHEGLWLSESGVGTTLLFGAALGLAWMGRRFASRRFDTAALATLATGFGAAVVAQGVIANPLWTDLAIGGHTPFDTLFVGYLLPTAPCFGLAWMAASSPASPARMLRGVAAVVVMSGAFVWSTLETRRFFWPDGMGVWRGFSQSEVYAFSAVWLVFGLGLLVYGVWRGYRLARYASGVFVILSTLKIFVFDLAGLEGPLRALSFIGLGGALIAIGLIYQRYVFAAPASQAT